MPGGSGTKGLRQQPLQARGANRAQAAPGSEPQGRPGCAPRRSPATRRGVAGCPSWPADQHAEAPERPSSVGTQCREGRQRATDPELPDLELPSPLPPTPGLLRVRPGQEHLPPERAKGEGGRRQRGVPTEPSSQLP